MLLAKATIWTPILGQMLTCQAASFASKYRFAYRIERHNATKSLWMIISFCNNKNRKPAPGFFLYRRGFFFLATESVPGFL